MNPSRLRLRPRHPFVHALRVAALIVADQPKRTYRKRCRVEYAVGWLKESRRLGTRYEKPGLSFLAFVKLGTMMQYLRKIDPSDSA